MRQSIAVRVENRQQQTLSPRLQQAVRLLQLSSLDFAQQVRDALDANPFLEAEETDDEEPFQEPTDNGTDLHDSATVKTETDSPLAPEDPDSERDIWQADGSSSSKNNDEGDWSPMDSTAIEASLADHLHGQINVLSLPKRDFVLAKIIIESLDDDGYLRTDLDELAEMADFSPPVTEAELRIALCRVQSLEPAGVAARGVGECLLLQLSAIEDESERDIAFKIISEHLDDLAAKDGAALARKCGCSPEQIESVCDQIRRLDPRPGWQFGTRHVQYVTPDVVVRKVRGTWTASLNPIIVPKVRVNHVYAEMYRRQRCANNPELAAHLQEARWMVRNVEQRFATILSVAQAIVKRQRQFLEYGPMAMKPLGLREIADEVGLHESTVSRVTNNKFMATPLGVFELKYFFSRAMTTSSGSAFSATAIRGLIKEMIAGEKPGSPLSDAEIARQLAAQGLVLARRTVTKYRQVLRIEAVERRRRGASIAETNAA
jgi:RNA polymerase sigma-54 factor